jgi:hypothetical protein
MFSKQHPLRMLNSCTSNYNISRFHGSLLNIFITHPGSMLLATTAGSSGNGPNFLEQLLGIEPSRQEPLGSQQQLLQSAVELFNFRLRANLRKDRLDASFGGIPNSRVILFLQIVLKRAAKPSAENTSAEPSQEPSPEPC